MTEKMSEIELKISFNTPAFLGNANQEGQWRTPPFKALIRQWWRVVKASEGCDIDTVRKEENILFGNAVDEKNSCQAKIRLKLENWGTGKSICVNAGKFSTAKATMSSASYLGYGCVDLKGNGSKNSLNPTETNTLYIRYPSIYDEEIKQTLQLIKWFGAIGSRSRNGWGSINIENAKLDSENICFEEVMTCSFLNKYSSEYTDLLKNDWAKGFGRNQNGLLIWKTNIKNKYEDVLHDLAQIKYDYRRICRLNINSRDLSERHIVALPISQVSVSGIDKNYRNPNQLRFKVIKDGGGSFYGLIFHMPCSLSNMAAKGFIINKYRELEQKVWPKIHNSLDNNNLCSRLK